MKVVKYSMQPVLYEEPLEDFLEIFGNLDFLGSFNKLTNSKNGGDFSVSAWVNLILDIFWGGRSRHVLVTTMSQILKWWQWLSQQFDEDNKDKNNNSSLEAKLQS